MTQSNNYFTININKKIVFCIIISFILLVSFEIVSFLAFHINEKLSSRRHLSSLQSMYARNNLNVEKLNDDIRYLFYDKPEYHPYRWYSITKNYTGNYVFTDEYGFRISRKNINVDTNKIAFFGGSTMFSISTADDGTIPYFFNSFLDSNVSQALNFGVGGYSSSAELMTLIEVTRLESNIRFAVFYDGVNEVYRYIERFQCGSDNKYYDVLGYQFVATSDVALTNYVGSIWSRIGYRPYSLKLLNKFFIKLKDRKKNRDEEIDYPKASKIIADIYIRNMQDITWLCKAKNIEPFFFIQPNIFTTTKKEFTQRELKIFNKKYRDVNLENLFKMSYKEILSDKRIKNLNFYDITDVLNDLDDKDHFHDACHVSKEGNKLIAAKIFSLFKNHMSTPSW